MYGGRGEEVGVAVRRRCGVCGELATPGVPTDMLSPPYIEKHDNEGRVITLEFKDYFASV